VRYVLEGSVRKAGDRLRITAQLIDGATGNHIWAERPAADVFAVQDDVTRNVVSQLKVNLPAARITTTAAAMAGIRQRLAMVGPSVVQCMPAARAQCGRGRGSGLGRGHRAASPQGGRP